MFITFFIFYFLKNMKQRLFDDNIIDLLVQNIFQRFLDSVARFWDNIAEHPQKSCKICLDKLDNMASFWPAHKIWR